MKETKQPNDTELLPLDVKTKALIYRAIARGNKTELRKAYEGLGAIPPGSPDLGGGEHLLPLQLSNQLVTEPVEYNVLRQIEQVSQIRSLEEPALDFIYDDEDLEDISDMATAKELKAEAQRISYGRFKTKVMLRVSDTVLRGTDTMLTESLENALYSSLARKEKMRAFSTVADEEHAHMSYYQTGIKAVMGENILDAIIAAWSDLPDLFAGEATTVMRKQDYYSAIRNLANGSETLFGKKPEEVIGIPVKFCDRAVVPVVGNFAFSRMNYNGGVILDFDKDIDAGEYFYVLTAWFDHQIKLKGAFRLAITRIMVIGAVAIGETKNPLAGENLTCSPVFNTNQAPGSGVSYAWQYLSSNEWLSASDWSGYNTNTLTTVDNQDEGVPFRCKVSYTDSDGNSEVYSRAITMA